MSQPDAWTPEYIERLGKIARGECLHPTTWDEYVMGSREPSTYCTMCRQHVDESKA